MLSFLSEFARQFESFAIQACCLARDLEKSLAENVNLARMTNEFHTSVVSMMKWHNTTQFFLCQQDMS